ncbi:MAG: PEP-CTERM sorting domain-containing protein [Alphaproteobacteria bacterium]
MKARFWSLGLAALAGLALGFAANDAAALTVLSFSGTDFDLGTGVGVRRFTAPGKDNADTGAEVDGNIEWAGSATGGSFKIFAGNTSSGDGFLTGLGFFLPEGFSIFIENAGGNPNDDIYTLKDDGSGDIWDIAIQYVDADINDNVTGCNIQLSIACENTDSFVDFELAFGDQAFGGLFIEFGAALGGNFAGGGSPNTGIPAGGAGAFSMLFSGRGGNANSNLTFLNTGSFARSDDESFPGTFWCARWRGIESNGTSASVFGSDKQCGNAVERVPEPLTLGLLGLGLIGLGVLRRGFAA